MDYVFTCPNCNIPFVVRARDFNCRILRHAVYKTTLQPIPPHSTKIECERLISEGSIYGCACPLKIIDSLSGVQSFDVVICDYI